MYLSKSTIAYIVVNTLLIISMLFCFSYYSSTKKKINACKENCDDLKKLSKRYMWAGVILLIILCCINWRTIAFLFLLACAMSGDGDSTAFADISNSLFQNSNSKNEKKSLLNK